MRPISSIGSLIRSRLNLQRARTSMPYRSMMHRERSLVRRAPRGVGRLVVAIAVVAAGALHAEGAQADAEVSVEVSAATGRSPEARVILTPSSGGPSASCTTSAGHCRLPGVAGGRYIVTAQPRDGGRAPVPRPVLIPDSGAATVRVYVP